MGEEGQRQKQGDKVVVIIQQEMMVIWTRLETEEVKSRQILDVFGK